MLPAQNVLAGDFDMEGHGHRTGRLIVPVFATAARLSQDDGEALQARPMKAADAHAC